MPAYPELRERVVVVTGAARGLGAALAEAFGAQGCRMLLTDVDADGLADVAAGQVRAGRPCATVAADLTEIAAYDTIVDAAIRHHSRVDILVNNAALLDRTPMEGLGVADLERALRVNLVAPYFLARRAILEMRRQGGGGRIVNIASMAARTGGVADIHAYAASKGGLVAVTKSLAKAVAADGILVNAVLPSNIESPMLRDTFPAEAIERTLAQVPLGRTAEPGEVAEAVLWLASDAASYVTGASWDVNGGWYMS